MPDMWIEKPALPRKHKVLIYKSVYDPFPWVLALPEKDGIARIIKYPDWHTPWLVAGSIQDRRNRNA